MQTHLESMFGFIFFSPKSPSGWRLSCDLMFTKAVFKQLELWLAQTGVQIFVE